MLGEVAQDQHSDVVVGACFPCRQCGRPTLSLDHLGPSLHRLLAPPNRTYTRAARVRLRGGAICDVRDPRFALRGAPSF